MAVKNLEELLVEELQDLYQAERQMSKILPRVAKAVDSALLRQALEDHLEKTEGHIARLERVFALLGSAPAYRNCEAMQAILRRGEDLLDERMEEPYRDAAIISATQRVEHYEISGYGTVRTFAQMLGMPEVARLLEANLEEEEAADDKLTQISLLLLGQEILPAAPGY